jgi:YrbI family 3-deoxy-D-manno-octulosonate 8-phosphate phosphatase
MKQVVLVVFDFDGVMTDNRVQVHESGEEAVWCHRGDGLGIARLKEAGFEVVVLSTEVNPVVGARCRKLKIEAFQGRDDKAASLRQLMHERAIGPEQIAYVGNDLNDIPCMRMVGWPIAVADAVSEVRALAKWVTRRPGGRGAVREVADLLLHSRVEADVALEWARDSLWRSIELRQAIAGSGELLRQIVRAASTLTDVLKAGGHIFILADGPGATDARGLAAEFARRLPLHAPSVTALTMPGGIALLPTAPDDPGSDLLLVRELALKARPGDLAIGLAGDGKHQAVLQSVHQAREMALRTILVARARAEEARSIADECVLLPVDDPWLIEDAHIWLGRFLGDYAARALSPPISGGVDQREP